MRACLLVSIASVALAAEPGSWTAARAPHFVVYSDASATATSSLADGIERLHAFFKRQLGVSPGGGPVRVIAFATEQEFAAYRTRPGSDAFFLGATGGDYIVLPTPAAGDLRVPAHEYAHLLLHSTGWKLPVWITEGISEVASTVRIGDRGVLVGGDIPGRSQRLKTGKWIPMTVFFSAAAPDDDVFYAQSWAAADLLLFSPKYAPSFTAFLATLATGTSPDRALQAVYRTTADVFAADIRDRLAHANFAIAMPAPQTAAAPVHAEATDARPLLAGLRGTIAHNRGDQAAALAEWKTAIDLGTDDAGVCYRYAVLTGDRAAYERTLTLDPTFDAARYQLAILEKDAGRLESAVEHLQKMSKPEPERAFSYWISLGDALLDLNRRTEARHAFASALDAAHTPEERKRAAELDWMASTELAVEFDGKEAHTVRVPVNGPPRNPFIERGDAAKSAEATLEHVECTDQGIQVKLQAAGGPLTLSVPDPSRVQIRNAGGVEFEITCGPQPARKVVVEYSASGILRGLELR